jgi:hypothetical protein
VESRNRGLGLCGGEGDSASIEPDEPRRASVPLDQRHENRAPTAIETRVTSQSGRGPVSRLASTLSRASPIRRTRARTFWGHKARTFIGSSVRTHRRISARFLPPPSTFGIAGLAFRIARSARVRQCPRSLIEGVLFLRPPGKGRGPLRLLLLVLLDHCQAALRENPPFELVLPNALDALRSLIRRNSVR